MARSTNRATDPMVRSVSMSRLPLGTARGGTGNSCSPAMRRPAREVTITLSFGEAISRAATCGDAASTCSKLSSTSRKARSFRYPPSRTTGSSAVWLRPIAEAIVTATIDGSATMSSGTKNTPSYRSERSAAICNARRVFPVPPGPVRVTSR